MAFFKELGKFIQNPVKSVKAVTKRIKNIDIGDMIMAGPAGGAYLAGVLLDANGVAELSKVAGTVAYAVGAAVLTSGAATATGPAASELADDLLGEEGAELFRAAVERYNLDGDAQRLKDEFDFIANDAKKVSQASIASGIGLILILGLVVTVIFSSKNEE